MIDTNIGRYAIYGISMTSGLFKKDGMTPFESVFLHPFEDLVFQLSVKIIIG